MTALKFYYKTIVGLLGVSTVGAIGSLIIERDEKSDDKIYSQFFGYSMMCYFILFFAPIIPPIAMGLSALSDVFEDPNEPTSSDSQEPIEVEIEG